MRFAPDTESGLRNAAALVNTADPETLTAVVDLERWLAERGFTFTADGTDVELHRVRALRPRLRQVWGAAARSADPPAEVSALLNALLADVPATPQLVVHDGWGWHLHMTGPGHALPDRIAAEAAMALVDLVRSAELARLRTCAAPDCDAVLVDLSRNRSKRFCDTGNCGNRQHVAAYRARRAADG